MMEAPDLVFFFFSHLPDLDNVYAAGEHPGHPRTEE